MTGKSPFPGEEPNAATRQMAKAFRQMFVALRQEGFTEKQALALIGEVLRNAIAQQKLSDEDEDDG